MDARSEISQLIQQSYTLPDGAKSKIELLKQAIQLADSHQLLELQYRARLALVEAGTFSGHGELSFSAFVWCIAHSKKFPDRCPISSLLWKFKYVLELAPEFVNIHYEQIMAMFEEMAKYYKQTGHSQRPVHSIKARALLSMGYIEEARLQLQLFPTLKRDYYADCSACELDLCVEGLFFSQAFDEGLNTVQPILSGKKRCAEIPHLTLANVLIPLLIMNQEQQALQYHQKGYRLIANNKSFLSHIAKHLFYCVHTQQLEQGEKIFQAHFSWALEATEGLKQLNFYIAAVALMEKLIEKKPRVELALPKSFSIYEESHSYSVAKLHTWLEDNTRALALQFDSRNKNYFYTHRFNKRHELLYQ